MKRLGIFCFYDRDGIVDSYVKYLLNDLREVVDYLVVIVNGFIDTQEEPKLSEFAEELIKRPNTGYDGGAYADFFVNYFDRLENDNFDELILINNSFFGPFIPFRSLFSKMMYINADFWGIREINRNAIRYLESYFLVFNKKIISGRYLQEFFKTNYDILINASYHDVCSIFERGLYSYLRYKGFLSASYITDCRYDIFYSPDFNIINCGVPLLKKKCIDFNNYSQQRFERLIEYSAKTYDYPISLINTYLDRLKMQYNNENHSVINNVESLGNELIEQFDISEEEIKIFLLKNKDIYIYGIGWIATNIWCFYKYYITNLKGFIVSDNVIGESSYMGYPVYKISEISPDSNIILALNRRNTLQVTKNVSDKRILSLWK